MLWIDFKLYFYVRIHKHLNCQAQACHVVNWFQIVFLREDSQEHCDYYIPWFRCELISNCIFTWGFTRYMNDCMISDKLWIDFKLYFYVRIHKDFSNNALTLGVVNWFQIVFLREDSQVVNIEYFCILGCELISNCIFTWGFTRFKSYAIPCLLLWIDFKLYFYVRIHKYVRRHSRHRFVVNWFQIVFLREDSQEKPKNLWQHNSCELISNCIFTWGFTRTVLTKVMLKALWIDFKLYFYVRIHKGMSPHVMSLIVVNWFQIVFLREDSQATCDDCD